MPTGARGNRGGIRRKTTVADLPPSPVSADETSCVPTEVPVGPQASSSTVNDESESQSTRAERQQLQSPPLRVTVSDGEVRPPRGRRRGVAAAQQRQPQSASPRVSDGAPYQRGRRGRPAAGQQRQLPSTGSTASIIVVDARGQARPLRGRRGRIGGQQGRSPPSPPVPLNEEDVARSPFRPHQGLAARQWQWQAAPANASLDGSQAQCSIAGQPSGAADHQTPSTPSGVINGSEVQSSPGRGRRRLGAGRRSQWSPYATANNGRGRKPTSLSPSVTGNDGPGAPSAHDGDELAALSSPLGKPQLPSSCHLNDGHGDGPENQQAMVVSVVEEKVDVEQVPLRGILKHGTQCRIHDEDDKAAALSIQAIIMERLMEFYEEDLQDEPQKTVRFSDNVRCEFFRPNSTILGRKNQKKAKKNRQVQLRLMGSPSDTKGPGREAKQRRSPTTKSSANEDSETPSTSTTVKGPGVQPEMEESDKADGQQKTPTKKRNYGRRSRKDY